MPQTTPAKPKPPRKTLRYLVYCAVHDAIHVYGDNRGRIADAVMKAVNPKLRRMRKKIAELQRRQWL